MKKVLFIGSFFLDEVEKEINKKTKSGIIQYAANNYQKAIIDGLSFNMRNVRIISAPFIGAYPMNYKSVFFKKHQSTIEPYHVDYVNFNNTWGYKNISRSINLKKAIRSMDLSEYSEVYVYSVHTPFLEAAKWIKKKYSNIKTCLIVPDLPEYMNLSNRQSWIYRFLKKIDHKKQIELMNYIDTFVLITEAMKERLPVGHKPYVVIEAVVDTTIKTHVFETDAIKKFKEIQKLGPTILYTGTLYERFGVLSLLDAFKDQFFDAQLVVCGDGDSKHRVNELSQTKAHIHYLGNITNREALFLQERATILINPRPAEEDFTKYSFPYKTVEYLKSGRPIIMSKLGGIPDSYTPYLNYLESSNASDIKLKIMELLKLGDEELDRRGALGKKFILDKRTPDKALKLVVEMLDKFEYCDEL